MDDIFQIAKQNQAKAREMIKESGVIEAWQSIGATVNLIGSLKLGLLMVHKDVDFHIYTDNLNIRESFQAISRLAENEKVKRIEYTNLLDADDTCLEWHAWYEDKDGDLWQIDMMHIVKGSKYDGHFEHVGDRIAAVISDEQRETILRLKYDTPENVKIPGIDYYVAVLQDHVSDYTSFAEWRKKNTGVSFMEWVP